MIDVIAVFRQGGTFLKQLRISCVGAKVVASHIDIAVPRWAFLTCTADHQNIECDCWKDHVLLSISYFSMVGNGLWQIMISIHPKRHSEWMAGTFRHIATLYKILSAILYRISGLHSTVTVIRREGIQIFSLSVQIIGWDSRCSCTRPERVRNLSQVPLLKNMSTLKRVRYSMTLTLG